MNQYFEKSICENTYCNNGSYCKHAHRRLAEETMIGCVSTHVSLPGMNPDSHAGSTFQINTSPFEKRGINLSSYSKIQMNYK